MCPTPLSPRARTCVLAVLALLAGSVGRAQEPPGRLIVRGQVERTSVRSDDPFLLWLTFENRTGQTVSGLRIVTFRHTGFEPVGTDCWPGGPKNAGPVCRAAGRGRGLPTALATGQAVILQGELRRGVEPGEFVLSGVYQWRQGPPGAPGPLRQDVFVVGPVQVAKTWSQWNYRLGEDWPALFKDLALPVVLLVLGSLYTYMDRKRTMVQETWNQMLPKSHEVTEKHYLRISSAVMNLRKGCRDNDLDLAFYHFALLFRLMRDMQEERGGFYFKNREGETLTASCWFLLYYRIARRYGTGNRDALIQTLTRNDTFSDFRTKLAPEDRGGWIAWALRRPQPAANLAELERTFQGLWRDFELELTVLGIFELLLDFEANRPYRLWYKKRETFAARQLRDFGKELERLWVEEGGAPKPGWKARLAQAGRRLKGAGTQAPAAPVPSPAGAASSPRPDPTPADELDRMESIVRLLGPYIRRNSWRRGE